MKLWLLTQIEVGGYDVYDSAIVAAETAEAAKNIHPSDEWPEDGTNASLYPGWATKPENVTVKLIGEAAPDIEPGVVLASFNAG